MSVEVGPDHPFQHVSRNVNKIVEQLQKGYSNFRPNDCWAPNVNLYETDELYLVCVDLAGVDKDKLDLELANDRLTLRGSRVVPTYGESDSSGGPTGPGGEKAKLKIHLMEIDHGAFLREVELPEQVAQAKITAHYRNGMLWIELPKN